MQSAMKSSKYRILGLVGRGQFGRVYCALRRQTGEFVALKALDRSALSTHQFLRELRFLVTLEHPNIVTCQAIEHLQGKRYLVIDYCEGGTLRQLMENHQQLNPTLSAKLICDVLTGLEYAHSQGVIHCDIKPENILLGLTPEGWVARISDFGISRLSQEVKPTPANITGSPAYMAPERFYGQYSHSTDLYAVGILLFELLAGYRPFSGLHTEISAAHFNQPINIPAHIPTPLQSVISTALEKLKARRFQSAAQMREALQSAIAQTFQVDAQSLATPIAPLLYAPEILREERLSAPVQQIGITETTVLPGYDRYIRRSVLMFLSSPETLQARWYLMGFFDRRNGKPLSVTTVPEPMRELTVRSQSCFAATERSIYRLSDQAPQLVTRLQQPCRIAIDPQGRWMAVATLGHDNSTKILSFWSLPQPKLIQPPTICPSSLGELIAIQAIDSRRVVLISQTEQATRFDWYNRRGQTLGILNLPVQLKQVFQSARPYCLVATEIGHERSLLLLHLKPYRLVRIALSIRPKFVTAFLWGVIICDEKQLIAIDYNGQHIGQSGMPQGVCAIAAHGEAGLVVATDRQGETALYTLNLEAMRSASL